MGYKTNKKILHEEQKSKEKQLRDIEKLKIKFPEDGECGVDQIVTKNDFQNISNGLELLYLNFIGFFLKFEIVAPLDLFLTRFFVDKSWLISIFFE